MSFQSSDSAHCAVSVCVLNVYIGAWTIQSVPTKTDCLGTIPQRDTLFKASYWPGNTFLYILPCSPQPLSQSLGDLIAELHAYGLSVAVKHVKMLMSFFFLP